MPMTTEAQATEVARAPSAAGGGSTYMVIFVDDSFPSLSAEQVGNGLATYISVPVQSLVPYKARVIPVASQAVTL